MSQSDYIKRKKIAVNLREYNEPNAPKESVPVVFSSGQLQAYKEFATINNIEMSVDNMEKLRYSQLVPGDKQLIFDMERQTAGCAPFIICAGTSSRPNRPTPDPAFVFDCHSNIRQSPFGWKVLKDPSHPLYAARRQRELDYLKKLGNCPEMKDCVF
jgi:hypothetical protein